MGRPKKDAIQINLKMDRLIAEKLEKYCQDTGQSRTTAIERILSTEIDKYYRQPEGKRIPK